MTPAVMVCNDEAAKAVAREAGVLDRLMNLVVTTNRPMTAGIIVPHKEGGWALCMRFWGFPDEKDNGLLALISPDLGGLQRVYAGYMKSAAAGPVIIAPGRN